MLFKHCKRNVNFTACFNREVLEYSVQTPDEGTRKVMKRRIRKQNIIVSYLSSKRNALIIVYTSLKASWCNIFSLTWQWNHFDKIWVSTSITLKMLEGGRWKERENVERLRKCKTTVVRFKKKGGGGSERESQTFLLVGMFPRPVFQNLSSLRPLHSASSLSSLLPPCFKVIPSFLVVFVWLSDDDDAGSQFSCTC